MSPEYESAMEVCSCLNEIDKTLMARMPTIRERAAIAALQGLLADGNYAVSVNSEGREEAKLASYAVVLADYLLAELAKPRQT